MLTMVSFDLCLTRGLVHRGALDTYLPALGAVLAIRQESEQGHACCNYWLGADCLVADRHLTSRLFEGVAVQDVCGGVHQGRCSSD